MPATTATADLLSAIDRARPLLRPELAELSSYVPHDPPGIDVKLDANEAPLVTERVREVVRAAISEVALERYPDPRALRLKEAIAKRTGARPDELLLGTGSDELIALLVNAVSTPRGRNAQAVVLSPTPTFVMYRMTARTHGSKPVEIPLDASWDLDVSMMKKAITMMQPSVVFVASPNNPTSNHVSDDRLEEILRATREDGAIGIVDEAYIDYAGESRRSWRSRYGNLGILRTLSKIGLAALRVGWLEMDEGIIREIDKTRQPFNVSATSQAAAAAVLEDAWDDVQAEVARVVRAREELSKGIAALEGFSVTPSAANFLWVKTPRPASEVFESLVKDGILVRSFHALGGRLATQLRITIGTDAQNTRLYESLTKVKP